MRISATGMRSASLVVLALTQTPAAGGTLEPPLATVLTQATHYVDQLHRKLAGVVMEERYEQLFSAPRTSTGSTSAAGRTLRPAWKSIHPAAAWACGLPTTRKQDRPR